MNKSLFIVLLALIACFALCAARHQETEADLKLGKVFKSIGKGALKVGKAYISQKYGVPLDDAEEESDKKIKIDDIFNWVGKGKQIYDIIKGLEDAEEIESDLKLGKVFKSIGKGALKIGKAYVGQKYGIQLSDEEIEADLKLGKALKSIGKGALKVGKTYVAHKYGVQLSDSEAFAPKSGATLQATTGLNVRSGPCTNNAVVRGLAAGQTTKFTGSVKTQCGYTWYSVTGGWAASNFLKEVGSGGGGSGSTCRTRSYPTFKQCDGRWGGNSLGSRSVCAIGCLMSSVSMALNGLGKKVNGQSPNPGVLNSFLKSNRGYQGNLFIWTAVSRFGLRYEGQPTSSASIKAAICANKVVILNVNRGGHWVLATGVTGSGYTVNDPGYSRTSYSFGEVSRAGVYSV